MNITCQNSFFLLLFICVCYSSISAQDPPEYRQENLSGHLAVPEKKDFEEDLLDLLETPEGFTIQIFAADLVNPRMIAVSDEGTVYVTIQKEDKVVSLKDTDGDGQADQVDDAITGIDRVHGITLYNGNLYVVNDTELYSASVDNQGKVGEPELLAYDLPDGGQHPNRTIAFDDEGALYLSVGSSCNACDETNPEHATVLKFNTDNFGRTVFSEGLRNTIGFDWHPETGELWGMDHGSDWRGDDLPPEELNKLEEGNHYGWPFVYGEREIDPFIPGEPEEMTPGEFARQSTPPALTIQAHSAPIGMVFYTGNHFPEEYHNDAFVAFRGSWNRMPPTGYKISRVRFNENGEPEEFEDFVTGFLQEEDDKFYQFGRLAGVAVHSDGSLLFSDDSNGVIYRVSYNEN